MYIKGDHKYTKMFVTFFVGIKLKSARTMNIESVFHFRNAPYSKSKINLLKIEHIHIFLVCVCVKDKQHQLFVVLQYEGAFIQKFCRKVSQMFIFMQKKSSKNYNYSTFPGIFKIKNIGDKLHTLVGSTVSSTQIPTPIHRDVSDL